MCLCCAYVCSQRKLIEIITNYRQSWSNYSIVLKFLKLVKMLPVISVNLPKIVLLQLMVPLNYRNFVWIKGLFNLLVCLYYQFITPAATAATQRKYRAIAISASINLVRNEASPIPKRKGRTCITCKGLSCPGSVSYTRCTTRKRNTDQIEFTTNTTKNSNYKKSPKAQNNKNKVKSSKTTKNYITLLHIY